jgi:hypothetical protein
MKKRTRQQTIARIVNTRAIAEAARAQAPTERVNLHALLESVGGDIVAQFRYPSPNSFKTAVNQLKRAQEA